MLHFIVNPVSGRTGCEKTYAKLHELLTERGIAHKATVSAREGEITDIAKQAVAEGASAVIAVGGDGSLVEAARGLVGSETAMGVIPGGTGNDLALSLGISRDPAAALEIILSGNLRQMDVGRLNGEYFLNVAGTGFDVDVLRNTAKVKRVLTGLMAYGAAVFMSILGTGPKHIRLETPGGVLERDVLLVAFANGQYYGGGMRVAPEADAFDGLLDICIVNSVPRWKIPILLSRFVKGEHLALPFCEYFKAPWAKIDGDHETVFNMDGDLVGGVPTEIELIPKALKIFCPPHD